MRKPVIELIVGLAVAVLSLAGLIEAWGYQGQSGLMPRAVMIAATLLAILWCLQSLRELRADGERIEFDVAAFKRFALLVGGGALYVFGIAFAGFFTSTVILVPAIAVGLGYRKWSVILLSTLGFVVILYAVFRLLLEVPLPDELILTLITGAGA